MGSTFASSSGARDAKFILKLNSRGFDWVLPVRLLDPEGFLSQKVGSTAESTSGDKVNEMRKDVSVRIEQGGPD